MIGWRFAALLAAFFGSLMTAGGVALAEDGHSHPWEMGFQTAASPVMREIVDFHDTLLWLIIIISVFVLLLMLYCFVKFNAKANPVPSKTTHNTLIEVAWTVIPIIILVVIAIPSFKLLWLEDKVADADLTIKAIGHQWYWSYEYPDQDNFTFDAVMLEESELKEGQPRLLATDTTIVVPVNATVRMLITADDVIHSWAMPAFGVKMDGVPGRLNETWFKAEREGIFYGQCSELCGSRHGFMPIQVKVVSKEEFDKWVEWAKQEYASADSKPRVKLAAAVAGN